MKPFMKPLLKDQTFTDAQLQAYADHIIASYKKYATFESFSRSAFSVTFEPGVKFIRVVTSSYGSRSSHSFIDAQGRIWKAASWKAPAQNFTRGNLLTAEFTRISWTGAN